jgi:hypothetical protein
MPIPKHIRLNMPWQELSINRAADLTLQLQRELSPLHILYGVEAKAVAARVDRDDALFELSGHKSQLAQVHLIWSQGPSKDPKWPAVQFFDDWENWVRMRLLPDLEGYGE